MEHLLLPHNWMLWDLCSSPCVFCSLTIFFFFFLIFELAIHAYIKSGRFIGFVFVFVFNQDFCILETKEILLASYRPILCETILVFSTELLIISLPLHPRNSPPLAVLILLVLQHLCLLPINWYSDSHEPGSSEPHQFTTLRAQYGGTVVSLLNTEITDYSVELWWIQANQGYRLESLFQKPYTHYTHYTYTTERERDWIYGSGGQKCKLSPVS